MNRKTKSVYMGVAALSSLILVTPANADVPVAMAPQAAMRGGQAPPQASGGAGSFMVVVARNLPADTANRLRQDLISDGFTTAETRPDSDGNSQVVLAGLPTSEQADGLMRELRSSGYTPVSVAQDSGNGQSQTVYRVEVTEFDNSSEAESASKTLADEGFVNVDVVEENGKYLLMLGTFNRREDAEALLSEVAGAGFALAEVVSRERIRQSTPAAATADLSGLSAAEQASTRDVLSMAEKVESGEASADEIKNLRERIQQLPENQRNIISQQESTRATEREKLARIFPLYRQFDQALATKDFPAAEQALAEVRAIDPTDIFLAGRLRQLEQARSGNMTGATTERADPAEVQRIINEARRLEVEGNRAEALAKYREASAMDPTHSEARGKIAELSSTSSGAAPAVADSGDTSGSIMDNKALVYGGGGLLALIVLGLLFKRKRKEEPAAASSSPGSASGTDFIDPLGSGSNYATPPSTDFSSMGTAAGGTAAVAGGVAGADMTPPGFATFGTDEEEEAPKPAPAPRPAPVEEESDTVSLDFGDDTGPAAAQPDEPVSINFADEQPPVSPNVTPQSGSALDADLESLLKGTFPGAPANAADVSPQQSASAGDGVEELVPPGTPATAEPRVIFEQSFEDETEGAAPRDWRGEYDYASLTVERLDEAGHAQCLCFHKSEGTGSASYHLTFPKATGHVTAEFDIRCDQKNKFLLGVYLEKDEDFKQSIHTIVHQLDANSPAALRIQGVAAPYEMATWRHVRFEIDLTNASVDGYIDNEQVVTGAALPSAPEYINTLSIRDNLATTGTLLLDNIRISEA